MRLSYALTAASPCPTGAPSVRGSRCARFSKTPSSPAFLSSRRKDQARMGCFLVGAGHQDRTGHERRSAAKVTCDPDLFLLSPSDETARLHPASFPPRPAPLLMSHQNKNAEADSPAGLLPVSAGFVFHDQAIADFWLHPLWFARGRSTNCRPERPDKSRPCSARRALKARRSKLW